MEAHRRHRSARNGFVVASVLLFGFLSIEYLRAGRWDYSLGTAFFLSQTVYWLSWIYYARE